MPNDRDLIAQTIDAFYEIISGSASRAHDWDRLHKLFAAGASILAYHRSETQAGLQEAVDAGRYVGRLASSLTGRDFFERGLDYEVTVAGHIAQVWSRYEAGADPSFSSILKTGTNLIHLIREGSDWRIASMLYADDEPRQPR